jgi:hypothetical protein
MRQPETLLGPARSAVLGPDGLCFGRVSTLCPSVTPDSPRSFAEGRKGWPRSAARAADPSNNQTINNKLDKIPPYERRFGHFQPLIEPIGSEMDRAIPHEYPRERLIH